MASQGDVGKRIKRLRVQVLGIGSQEEFARRLGGVTRGAVGNWERGQGIKQENIRRIADEFKASYEWLATGRGSPLIGDGSLTNSLNKSAKLGLVTVKGSVKAGHWQEIEGWAADSMMDGIPSSSDYPLEWQYALIVDGESLNRVARHGDRLVCLDLIKSAVPISDGDLVIVERTRFAGQMVERTAKRVRQTTRGKELWPESDDPQFQSPIPYEPVNGNPEHDGVNVVAKVLWVLRKP